VPCEEQALPNLHSPGGPIPAFPILDPTPGEIIKPPAPVPNIQDAIDSAGDFVDNILPLAAKQEAAYQRREARAAELKGLLR
jgi:hypothetical protein